MYENKSKEILTQILRDMDDFAQMKGLDYPPIYFLGGSGCIIAGYLNRATTDLDLLDMEYDGSIGRLLRILDKYDLISKVINRYDISERVKAAFIENLKLFRERFDV